MRRFVLSPRCRSEVVYLSELASGISITLSRSLRTSSWIPRSSVKYGWRQRLSSVNRLLDRRRVHKAKGGMKPASLPHPGQWVSLFRTWVRSIAFPSKTDDAEFSIRCGKQRKLSCFVFTRRCGLTLCTYAVSRGRRTNAEETCVRREPVTGACAWSGAETLLDCRCIVVCFPLATVTHCAQVHAVRACAILGLCSAVLCISVAATLLVCTWGCWLLSDAFRVARDSDLRCQAITVIRFAVLSTVAASGHLCNWRNMTFVCKLEYS